MREEWIWSFSFLKEHSTLVTLVLDQRETFGLYYFQRYNLIHCFTSNIKFMIISYSSNEKLIRLLWLGSETLTYNARMTLELVHRQRLEDIKEKSSLACLQWRISKNVDAITSGSEGSKGRKERSSEHLCCPEQWSGYEQTVGKQITKSCWWGTKGDGKLAVETGEERVFVIWCLKTLLNCVLKVYGKQNLYIMNLNICRFLNKWLKADLSFLLLLLGLHVFCFVLEFAVECEMKINWRRGYWVRINNFRKFKPVQNVKTLYHCMNRIKSYKLTTRELSWD